MATGKVKWFNNAKGYGFIFAEAGGEDLFVHYSSIQMDGYKTLKAGQAVEFDIQQGPKGLHAVNIRSGVDIDECWITRPLRRVDADRSRTASERRSASLSTSVRPQSAGSSAVAVMYVQSSLTSHFRNHRARRTRNTSAASRLSSGVRSRTSPSSARSRLPYP